MLVDIGVFCDRDCLVVCSLLGDIGNLGCKSWGCKL